MAKIHTPVETKSLAKTERERRVLLALVDHYIEFGEPVGSNTLKEIGFPELSSATIRNYFAELERDGYLIQQHISGGRIPTAKAYQLYAAEFEQSNLLDKETAREIEKFRTLETREVSSYLQQAAEELTRLSQMAVFLCTPRFDHDFVVDLKLVHLDSTRALCIILSDFGVIRTEVLLSEEKLNAHLIKRIEGYFHWRLSGHDRPENLTKTEEELGQSWYNEIMVRYIVGYAHFNEDDLCRCGFSQLLNYPEFEQPAMIAQGLALFENRSGMRLILRECMKRNALRYWIGPELAPFTGPFSSTAQCTVITCPYKLNVNVAGAIGLLGPMRLPYRRLFALLQQFSTLIGETLTQSLYKYKIQYRQPQTDYRLNRETALQLEDQRKTL